jgi:hypothetical protein
MALKIAIVGGGWTGCHLASRLIDEADVTLFERNEMLISETSLINQNRLHYGYHYARNHATRMLCRNTFERFMPDYGHLTENIQNNFYAVSEDESLLDADTIRLIFKDWPHTEADAGLLNRCSLVLHAIEKYISPTATGKYFEELLFPIVRREEINESSIALLKQDYDFVLDCTNNSLLPAVNGDYFEAVVMFVYRPLKTPPFGALTFIDGDLFSIYPYGSSMFSLSHVKFGIIEQKQINCFGNNYGSMHDRRCLMEEHAMSYWPEFNDYFQYVFPVVSIKAKSKNASAQRTPIFRQHDNLLSFYTGKIQGIYAIEEMAKEAMSQA